MANEVKKPRNFTLSFEDAHEAVQQLTDMTMDEIEGVTLYSGIHPEYGAIHITIPAIGDGMILLPFALQQF